VETYAETVSPTLRTRARHVALSVLHRADALSGRARRNLERPRVQVLHLHSVFPDEEDGFRRLLGALRRNHTLLPYGEAVARLRSGPIDEPIVAFTFDDGLATCLRAASILEEFGARACFFVCPSIVGERDEDRIARFCRDNLHSSPMRFLSWEDLENLRTRGHEVGSHTSSHANLAAVDEERMHAEIQGSRERLVERLGSADHFAWPYGRFEHFSPTAAQEVFRAGYSSCASAERGCHVAPSPDAPRDLCLRRDLVVGAWPVEHNLYFVSASAARASASTNEWPESWRTTWRGAR
jgi:peptidoglycan/xylan/chitin deacetylase (PgdA/CDA1 family)